MEARPVGTLAGGFDDDAARTDGAGVGFVSLTEALDLTTQQDVLSLASWRCLRSSSAT